MPPKTERQTLMFSATFPPAIQQLATEFLNDHVFITVGQVGAANQDIVQEIVLVKNTGEKKDLALKFILETMNEAKDESKTFFSSLAFQAHTGFDYRWQIPQEDHRVRPTKTSGRLSLR